MNIVIIDSTNYEQTSFTKEAIADFLVTALEQYGDKKEDILKCLDYALSREPGKGGMITLTHENEKITGVVVINHTGMADYIPEHILVYIAVDSSQRGKGVGKALMETVIKATSGSIALHVEPDNPARRLYERLGFTSKYLEMRLHK
ncbi:MAG: GNAT family N-acetyltransferase [Bacteroidetes bacterium]|nr:GNAT family N-acetyltransferase [Bacteroidota bacterium]MCH8523126.1 GNAT family N-acetyltransferase [Balneolales bacterium]